MIGLAMKAGKVASGEFSTEKAVKEHKAYMVIVADDSSDNTKKNTSEICVSTIRCQCISLAIKKSWDMR